MGNELAIIRDYARSEAIVERFAEIVGNHQAMAYISSVLLAVGNNEALQRCTPQSIITCAMRAATLQLSCDPATGQAYLVPFKGKATLVVGYRGLMTMAIRTGKYRFINCAKIREGMEVTEDIITGVHRVEGGRKPNGEIIGYLGYFELYQGFSKSIYMTVDEIMEHARKYSKSFGNADSPWNTHRDAMCQKTVMRLLITRYGVLNPMDARVLEDVDGEDVSVVDVQLPDPEDVIEEHEQLSEGEILDTLGFGTPNSHPQQPTQQTTQQQNGQRPYQPRQLFDRLAEIAGEKQGKKASPAQRGLAVGVMNTIFGGDESKRKEVLFYLTGCQSFSDVPDQMALALIDWLAPTKDSGGAYEASAMATREAFLVLNEVAKANGMQTGLFGEEE